MTQTPTHPNRFDPVETSEPRPPWNPYGAAAGLAAPPAPGPSSRRRIAEISVAALLAAGLASGGTYAAVRSATPDPVAAQGPSRASSQAANPPAPVAQTAANAPDWAATASAVSPSVVAISVSGAQGQGQGSGVIIDRAGHIVTNNHVATGAGRTAQLRVTLDDGRSYAARIVGADPSTDLAVLQLDNPPTDLVPVSFGDSSALRVGDPVMAVGNPLGLAGTVTTGIVSALDRPVTTGGDAAQRDSASVDPVVTSAIQTSAAINPGNSGGALVNANGQLVGVNSSIASLGGSNGQSGSIGIGFAIPANEAKTIADQLIATGSAQHAYLGVSSTDGTVSDGDAQRSAAIVRSVSPGTPAAQSGLQVGDAVVAIDGQRVDSSLSLVAQIRERTVGADTKLTVIRGGQRLELAMTLGARPGG